MGTYYAKPMEDLSQTLGFVAMSMVYGDMFYLIQATPEVVEAILDVARETFGPDQACEKVHEGVHQFKFPGFPFYVRSGATSAVKGKVFVLHVLERMSDLGYDFLACSDFVRVRSHGTMLFRKAQGSSHKLKLACLSPGGHDRLVLARCPAEVEETVKSTITAAWPGGIQDVDDEEIDGERVRRIKLTGTPWLAGWPSGNEAVHSRILLASLVQTMRQCGWRFHAAVNIKGGTDTVFFRWAPPEEEPPDQGPPDLYPAIAVISLNDADRLRVINFAEDTDLVAGAVKKAVVECYSPDGIQAERIYEGYPEIKVKGRPFFSQGVKAAATRKLIMGIMAELRQRGYKVLTGLDVSRKNQDKTSIFFVKPAGAVPSSPEAITGCSFLPLARYGCVALSRTHKVKFIGFPKDILDLLKGAVTSQYLPGVRKEGETCPDCYELKLKGEPWQSYQTFSAHGLSLVLVLLKELYRKGWKLVLSADVSAKCRKNQHNISYPRDVHSLFFQHVEDKGAASAIRYLSGSNT